MRIEHTIGSEVEDDYTLLCRLEGYWVPAASGTYGYLQQYDPQRAMSDAEERIVKYKERQARVTTLLAQYTSAYPKKIVGIDDEENICIYHANGNLYKQFKTAN